MEMLRFAFITIFCFGFIVFLLHVIIQGLRSGRVAYKDSHSVCDRRKNPLGFWLLGFLFLAVVLMFVYVWIDVVFRL